MLVFWLAKRWERFGSLLRATKMCPSRVLDNAGVVPVALFVARVSLLPTRAHQVLITWARAYSGVKTSGPATIMGVVAVRVLVVGSIVAVTRQVRMGVRLGVVVVPCRLCLSNMTTDLVTYRFGLLGDAPLHGPSISEGKSIYGRIISVSISGDLRRRAY